MHSNRLIPCIKRNPSSYRALSCLKVLADDVSGQGSVFRNAAEVEIGKEMVRDTLSNWIQRSFQERKTNTEIVKSEYISRPNIATASLFIDLCVKTKNEYLIGLFITRITAVPINGQDKVWKEVVVSLVPLLVTLHDETRYPPVQDLTELCRAASPFVLDPLKNSQLSSEEVITAITVAAFAGGTDLLDLAYVIPA